MKTFTNITCFITLTNTFTRIACGNFLKHFLHFYSSNHLILYSHIKIHYYSSFVLNYIYLHLIYIYTHTIHAELKILFHLLPALNTFTLIYFILFGTCIQAYGLLMVLQLPPHLFTLTINE